MVEFDRRTWLHAMLLPFRDKNPSKRRPFVTYSLIAINGLVFLAYWPLFNDRSALQEFFFEWALIPIAVVNGHQALGLVTSMFLHGGIIHICGNMLALHIYGDNLEDTLGHIPFLLFYLFCGVASAIAHAYLNPTSHVPTVGASGAIAGVMGGYMLMFPKARIDILIFLVFIIRVVSVSAWIVLGIWILVQFHGAASYGSASYVAYGAHIAGFLVGAGLMVPAWLRRGGTRFWSVTGGHPDHPESRSAQITRFPTVRRRKNR